MLRVRMSSIVPSNKAPLSPIDGQILFFFFLPALGGELFFHLFKAPVGGGEYARLNICSGASAGGVCSSRRAPTVLMTAWRASTIEEKSHIRFYDWDFFGLFLHLMLNEIGVPHTVYSPARFS